MYKQTIPNNRVETIDPSFSFYVEKILLILDWIYSLTGVQL